MIDDKVAVMVSPLDAENVDKVASDDMEYEEPPQDNCAHQIFAETLSSTDMHAATMPISKEV